MKFAKKRMCKQSREVRSGGCAFRHGLEGSEDDDGGRAANGEDVGRGGCDGPRVLPHPALIERNLRR